MSRKPNIAEHPSGQTDPSVHDYLDKLGDQAWHRSMGIDDHPITIIRHRAFPGWHVRATVNNPGNVDSDEITYKALEPLRMQGKSEAVLDEETARVLLNPTAESMFYQYQVLCDPRKPEDEEMARKCLLRKDQMLIGIPMELWKEVFRLQSQTANSYNANGSYMKADPDPTNRIAIDA